MFIGRKKELATLEKLYNSNELNCVCLTGDAGIGKTALLQEFARRKHKAYFCVRASTNNANKAAFYTELSVQGIVQCSSGYWQDILKLIYKKAKGEKIVLLIDDVQELENSFSELLPEIIACLQTEAEKLRLLLVFSGRECDYVLHLLGKSKLPLSKIFLQSLNYEDVLPCLIPFSNEEKVLLYGVTGGKPAYLQLIDSTLSFKDNLYNLFFSPTASLLHVAEQILALHFRQPHIYHAILCSVACGAIHMKEIAEAVGMPDNKTSKYVGVLVEKGLLKKLVPLVEAKLGKQQKTTCYILADTMLTFWYRFVYPFLSSIAIGCGNYLLRTKVLTALDDYAKVLFLEICRQYCYTLRERGDFHKFMQFGYFWPKDNCAVEQIRLIAYDKNSAGFMQCVWEKSKVDVPLIKQLQDEYADKTGRSNYYTIFSRRGFTDRALGYAARTKEVRLVSLFYLK